MKWNQSQQSVSSLLQFTILATSRKGIRFFRVIEGFMAQFGIPGKPALAKEWREKTIKDDPVKEKNLRGFVSFATSGKNAIY